MNKSEIAAALARDLRISERRGKILVEAVLDQITQGLVRDGSVTLQGFGTFEVASRAPRAAYHVGTGETIRIGETWRVTFKTGTGLRAAVQPERER